MRKQYHFRPSEDGLQAWDMDRVAALARDLPAFEVPLDSIRELDEPYWFGGGAQDATCRAVLEHARLIAEADLSFPIILSSDGRVMDGMHRVAKAVLAGMATIAAVRFAQDPAPDFIGVRPEDLPYEGNPITLPQSSP